MTKNQILQKVLEDEIPGALYIDSKQIMNSNDNVHVINYLLNDEEKTVVIPDFKIKKVKDADVLLTTKVLKMVLKEEIIDSVYLEYVYTYSLKKYTVFYSSPQTKESSIAITLDDFSEHLKRFKDAEEIENQIEESNRESSEIEAIKFLLQEEDKLSIYLRHELVEGDIPEDNFYTVYYHRRDNGFDDKENSNEFFTNIDQSKILDLLSGEEDESEDDDLSHEAKEYFDQTQSESETNLPPRALPFKGRPGVRPKNDKIFNNDWNNVEMDYGNNVTIDEEFNFKYFSTDVDYHEFKKINDEIYEIAKSNPNLAHILPKESETIKVSKREADKLYLEIRKSLEGKYPEIFIFTNVCDFLNTTYSNIYEKLPSKLKEILIRELDEKYNILKKKGLKKLF